MIRVAILQARAGSTRLPRKVLADLAGRPMLAQIIARLERCRRLDRIVVATTDRSADDEVAAVARRAGAGVFRGSEQDVLSRYVGAAREAGADLVVRITADCPLIDPATVDRVVDALRDDPASADYASNVVERTYPRGLDVEALFRDTLERLHRRAVSAPSREHVTHYVLRERPDLFTLRSVVDTDDNSDLRWTVDEPADLQMVTSIYSALDLGMRDIPYGGILGWLRAHPEVARINAHVAQKA